MTTTKTKTRQMTKKEWLDERVFRDTYGRPYNLSDVPMTYMSRYDSFKKQGASDTEINDYWNDNSHKYQMEVQSMDCSICGLTIKPNEIGWAEGNNAEPVNDGRCCDTCNHEVVIPTRIQQMNDKITFGV